MMPAVQAESSAKKVSLILCLAVCFATGSLDARVNPIGATVFFLPSLPDLVDLVGLVVFVVHWTLDEMDNQLAPTFLWFQLSPGSSGDTSNLACIVPAGSVCDRLDPIGTEVSVTAMLAALSTSAAYETQ